MQIRVKSELDHEEYVVRSCPPIGAAAAAAAAAAGRGRAERLDLALEAVGGGGEAGGVRVAGDVKVLLRDDSKGGKAVCFFWVHTQVLRNDERARARERLSLVHALDTRLPPPRE